MIEEGKYRAIATSAALGTSQNGSEQIGIMFQVTQGEHAGSGVGYRGYFTDKTYERTIESLRHAGWSGNDLSVFTECDESACNQLLPSEVEIVVEHEAPTTPEGKMYARVKWVNKLGAGVVSMKNKMDAGTAKSFAERMRGACAAVPVAAGAAPVSPRQPQQQRPATPVARPAANRRDEPPPGFFDDNDDFPR